MDGIILTDKNFDKEVLKSNKPVLVDFWAPWCNPCLILAPTIEELAKEFKGKIKVGTLNVDENQEMANRFQIMSIPTLIIFKNGEIMTQMVGPQSKGTLVNRLNIL